METYSINTDNISALTTDILEIADEACNKLYDIEKLVSDSKSYFKGDAANICHDKFDNFLINFPTIKSNIMGYAEELNRLKGAYQNKIETINLEIMNNAVKMNKDNL